MSEKYNTNINSIEEAIKQLEDLKKDRLSFVTGDKEHDEIYLKDIQAIKIVLGNLEALCDMQKTADRELENARRINEEHKRENADLMKAINVVEKEKGEWIEDCNNLKKKVKELEEKNNEMKNLFRIQASIAKELDFKEEEKMIRVRGMYYVPDTMTITDNIGKPKRIELSYVDVTKLLGEL